MESAVATFPPIRAKFGVPSTSCRVRSAPRQVGGLPTQQPRAEVGVERAERLRHAAVGQRRDLVRSGAGPARRTPRPQAPSAVVTVASMVGVPRLSKIGRRATSWTRAHTTSTNSTRTPPIDDGWTKPTRRPRAPGRETLSIDRAPPRASSASL